MATKNTMTPSGGIFQSQQGGALGFGSPTTRPRTIQEQISHDIQRQALERWKILQETQMKIFQLQREATEQRARTGELTRRMWEQFIRR